jgi:hypothetical protein
MGHDAVHVSDLPNGNRSTDAEVIAAADEEGRVVVSKDSDFRLSHLLRGQPSRLLAIVTRQRQQYRLTWVVQHERRSDSLRARREQLRRVRGGEPGSSRRTRRSLISPSRFAQEADVSRFALTYPPEIWGSNTRMVRVRSGEEVRATARRSERQPSRAEGRQAVVVGSGTAEAARKSEHSSQQTRPRTSHAVARCCARTAGRPPGRDEMRRRGTI